MASMNFMLKLVTYNNIIILQIRLKKKKSADIFRNNFESLYGTLCTLGILEHTYRKMLFLSFTNSLTSSSLRTMSLTCYLIDCTAAAIAIYIPI